MEQDEVNAVKLSIDAIKDAQVHMDLLKNELAQIKILTRKMDRLNTELLAFLESEARITKDDLTSERIRSVCARLQKELF